MRDPSSHLDRRDFLKRGLAAGGLLATGGLAIDLTRSGDGSTQAASARAPGPPRQTARRPNILVVMVDQLRSPSWLPATSFEHGLLPNLGRLRRGAVSFERHYTAANDCTPARSTLLTGLYTHQTGCLITGASTLDPAFPTWGSMLREQGYRTFWYGKWHLTHGDNHWSSADAQALEAYGFSGGTWPSPDGGPGQGWRRDPAITRQFEQWFAGEAGGDPWCTTVSLVNPHDIAWWYGWSDRVPAEADAPSVARQLPHNFETPEQLIARGKPALQRSLQDTAARSFGAVPFTGPDLESTWLPFLDLYVKLQREVDRHVGRILDTLASRPEIAANTVVVFTSDHGEYGASHGLRGKGASAYEEAIRVPLLVKDPRGTLTRAPGSPRRQLTSSVDLAPLLLSIAAGSGDWRRDSHYSQLAERLDLAAILADPSAPGRAFAMHATDEIVTEFATEPYAADAPRHVAALLTPQAKYATYSDWSPATLAPQLAREETELYDYSSRAGSMELQNDAGASPLEAALRERLRRAYHEELRRPLPERLRGAQQRGYENYRAAAAHAERTAASGRPGRFGHLSPAVGA